MCWGPAATWCSSPPRCSVISSWRVSKLLPCFTSRLIFGVSQPLGTAFLVVIGAGAIVGTLFGGRLADRLVGRKIADGRVLLAGLTFVGAAVVFLPGLAVSSLLVAVPFFLVAALFVSAPGAPLAAARLDVVPSGLWGRAEAVRTFARNLLQGFAPLLFGYVSSLLGGPHANLGVGLTIVPHQVQAAAGRGRVHLHDHAGPTAGRRGAAVVQPPHLPGRRANSRRFGANRSAYGCEQHARKTRA